MTAQTGDLLKVGEGFAQEDFYLLSTEPLESYLESVAPKFRFMPPDTSLWRGYRATWQLDKDDRLMLIDFHGYSMTELAKGVQYLFPGESRVFAYWFTGVHSIIKFLFKQPISFCIFAFMNNTFFEPQLLLFYAILFIGLISKPWSKKRKTESGNLKMLGVIGWALIVLSSLLIITAINSNISGIIFLGMVIFVVIWVIYEVFRLLNKRRN